MSELIEGLTVSDFQALYFDKDALREPAYKLKRVDFEGARWYYTIINSEIFWSISTTGLLDKTLAKPIELLKYIASFGSWEAYKAEMRRLAAYGTSMHVAIESYILGAFDLSYKNVVELLTKHKAMFDDGNIKKLRKDVLAIAQFCIDRDVKPLAVEVMVFDPVTKVAGTIDLLCEMTFNGKRIIALVDFKSGRKGFWESHELQLHIYKRLCAVQFPDIHIDKIFNLAPNDWHGEPSYKLKDQTNTSDFKIDHLLAMYHHDYPVIGPKSIRVFNGTAEFGKPIGNLYSRVNAEEFVKRNDEYFKNQYVTLSNGDVKPILGKPKEEKEYEPFNPFATTKDEIKQVAPKEEKEFDTFNPFDTTQKEIKQVAPKVDKQETLNNYLDF